MKLLVFIFTYLIHQKLILCGYSHHETERIFNGTTSEQEDFPWHAAIAIEHKNNHVKLCGGSLISSQWILTAAQCIDGATSFSIGVGKNNLDSYETSELIVSEIGIKHELYNNVTKAHNIGLIKLPAPIFFSDRINKTNVANWKTNITEDVYISGYGKNEFDEYISPQQTYLQLQPISNERCRDYYENLITPQIICAQPFIIDQGVCNNDFGGALVQRQLNTTTQIGIFSFHHTEGCHQGSPFVFTRTSLYIAWINNKTGLNLDDGNNSITIRGNQLIYLTVIFLFIINA